MAVEVFDMGRRVLCDSCDGDWTEREESGGILFVSKAICPECAPRWENSARAFGETGHIRARCVPGMAFSDWVRELRGGNNKIRVLTGEDALRSILDPGSDG